MNASDIVNRFTYHQPTEAQLTDYASIRQKVRDLAHHLNAILPESREKSLAVTHLEEVVFWANAAIARHGPDEVPPAASEMSGTT